MLADRRLLVLAVVLGAWLLTPASASAAACDFTGASPGSWHTDTNWSCNAIPGTGDSVTIGNGDTVTVGTPAGAGSLSLTGGGTITFSGSATLAVTGAMSTGHGFVQGPGTLTVAGAFSKTTIDQLIVRNDGAAGSPDVVLNGTGTLSEGAISVGRNDGSVLDKPGLYINANLTIADGAATNVFPSTDGPTVHIGSGGHLIKAAAGTMQSSSGIDNDGTLTVQAGTLNIFGPTAPETSDGAYLANAGATLGLNDNIPVGATGRLGGAGTISIRGLNVTLAAGATLDPAVLTIFEFGILVLNGTAPVTLPVLNIHGNGFGATLDSTRPVTATAVSVTSGGLQGNFALTVPAGGSFSKTTSGLMFVRNNGAQGSADLILNVDATVAGGSVCVARNDGSVVDKPGLYINEDFTIADGVAADAFPCTDGPTIHIGSGGHLKKAAAGTMQFSSGIDNDGTLTVQAGTLNMFGPTAPETSDGAHIANAGTTLALNNNIPVGASGRVGGAGTISIRGLNVTLAAGAILDPAVLTIFEIGVLVLNGTQPVTLPVLNLHGNGFLATLDSSRPVTATAVSVTSGALQRDFVLTVPAGGSFTKTTGDPLYVRNSGAQGSADLVLNVNATLAGGFVCVARDGDQDPDQPNLHINRAFTIGAGAASNAFPCGGVSPFIHVNGPSGHLTKAGAGTTTFNNAVEIAGGTMTIDAGQTFALNNGVTLNGGVLRGAGQVTGNVTNTSGIVRPGSSPGKLTVTGNYSQGSGGTLAVEIDGTDLSLRDLLSVGGTATLGGTLAVESGFEPQLSDTFEVLTATTRSGTFSTVAGQLLTHKRYVATYGADNVVLGLEPSPQPGPVALYDGNAVHGGDLRGPAGVAVDGGDIFVADTAEHRIMQFTAAGDFVRAWGWGVDDGASAFQVCTTLHCHPGAAGGGGGQLNSPTGVATDGLGNVYVADTGNHRISQFTTAGAFVRSWGYGVRTGLPQPEMCGPFDSGLPVCTSGGVAGGAPGQLSSPSGIAVDGAGNLFVADTGNHRVVEFTGTGTYVRAWGLDVGAHSAFEICTTPCKKGEIGSGAGEMNGPRGITVDRDGNVFVADTANHRVNQYTTAGAFVGSWGSPGAGAGQYDDPRGIVTDMTGKLYVADTDNDRVSQHTTSGHVVGGFTRGWGFGVDTGTPEHELCTTATVCQTGIPGADAGQLDGPAGIATDCRGAVYVADTGNDRVQRFGEGSPALPPCPAVPRTVIDTGPAEGSTTANPQPGFSFHSVPAGATFECKVDDGAFGPCSTVGTHGQQYTNGPHTFQVRGTNANGVGPTAIRHFIVAADSGATDPPPSDPPPADPPPSDPPPSDPPPSDPPPEDPPPLATDPTPGVTPLTPRVGFPLSVVTVSRRGVAAIPLSCPRSATSPCVGALSLTTVSRIRISARRRLKLGSKSFRIQPGTRARVKVKLTRRGFRVVKGNHALPVVAKARTTSGLAPAATAKRKITLKPPR